MGAHLGVWVHSLTFSYTPANMKCDSRASLSARTFPSPCFGYDPKAKVVTKCITSSCMNEWECCLVHSSMRMEDFFIMIRWTTKHFLPCFVGQFLVCALKHCKCAHITLSALYIFCVFFVVKIMSTMLLSKLTNLPYAIGLCILFE